MSLELKYATADKTLDSDGWLLDYDYLNKIQDELMSVDPEILFVDREVIEALLLVANGETDLLRRLKKELEDF